ncbi:hypothetical protein ACFQFC_16265 [Amorphoplanes digitatis]|uniref:FtsH ternary system domain-containing protein n=1 Tax=Actinoplanes digitatis TaxID=1868 RepID=A0A7W7I3M4_9ACTN|nr:molecular chaperone DnaJ [Actinoplanes digitatis]MBB4765767.1 hypothetical protein [Actinoplanes digitatis]BFE75671.1 hypothetical protein GCM10020092_089720 [Actinoplanes digitatis]GID93441.1 hypothetical protein Adi01nite_28530 [Actinoplanes digitatis]
MCNPRRVEVTATRQLDEAWEHEIRRLSLVSATAVGEATVREALDDSIGEPTLEALVGVLERTEGWERDGDAFRYALPDGHVTYHVEDQELEIVVRLSAEVEAEAEAVATAGGRISETLTVTGQGTYYDDGWGDITEDDAARAAQADAQRLLDGGRRERLQAEAAAAEREHDRALTAEAGERARALLDERLRQRSERLRTEALRRLSAAGILARTTFYQALAQALRDTLVAYARANNAEGLTLSESDGVLNIQFELRV